MSGTFDSEPAPAAKAKRPFVKPTWSKPKPSSTPQSSSTSSDLFSSRDKVFSQIVREKARKQQEKEARKLRRSSKDADEPTEREGKRRRISTENEDLRLSDDDDDDDLYSAPTKTVKDEASTISSSSRAVKPERSSSRRSPSQTLAHRHQETSKTARSARPPSHSKAPEVVDLGDSSDGEIQLSTKFGPQVKAVETDDEEDDEDLRALKVEARAKKRQRDLEAARGTPTLEDNAEGPDPIIELLVVSSIPDTKSLMVKRRASQRLQEVRLAWCDKQGFPPEVAEKIFFTFKGRKQYDITSCKSLGLKIEPDGSVFFGGQHYFDDENRCKLTVEAVTEEIHLQNQKEAAHTKGNLRSEERQDSVGQDTRETETRETDTLIKVILAAKGLEEFKLKVKPSTTFEKMAGAFRSTKGILADKQITLMFDGEPLEPVCEIKDSEVEDMDKIEVLIR